MLFSFSSLLSTVGCVYDVDLNDSHDDVNWDWKNCDCFGGFFAFTLGQTCILLPLLSINEQITDVHVLLVLFSVAFFFFSDYWLMVIQCPCSSWKGQSGPSLN